MLVVLKIPNEVYCECILKTVKQKKKVQKDLHENNYFKSLYAKTAIGFLLSFSNMCNA